MERLVRVQLAALFFAFMAAPVAADSITHIRDALSPGSTGVMCGKYHDLIAMAKTLPDCDTDQRAVIDTGGTLHMVGTFRKKWTTATGVDLATGNKVKLMGPVLGFNRDQKVLIIGITDDYQGHVSLSVLVTN